MTAKQAQPYDLTRTFLLILIIAALVSGSVWTLWPFLSALLWATMIVIATWPLLVRLEARVGGRRWLAALLMTVVIAAVFVVPLGIAIAVLLDVGVRGVELVRGAMQHGLQPLPDWLVAIPWVGPRIDGQWQALAASGPEGVAEALRPFARSAASWTLAVTGGIGVVAVHFVLTVILAAILYTSGEKGAAGVLAFAKRIGRDRGERTIRLAAQAVRGVALGVVVTALLQSLVAGLGLWATGVPRWGVLLALTFVLCIAQLGPLLVLLPAVVWLFWSGSVGAGTALAIVAVIVAVIDNVLKPVLIRRGVDLPLLLLLAGVIGGLIAFGVVGLFIGPVILAVTYTQLQEWVREAD